MTAEIVIMNKEAIALASDSAVTMGAGMGKEKIFTSANKLFTLSNYHPVGIMVYGSAIFMGVPWETIIKIYRNNLGKKKFNTLKEYAPDFITFLDGNVLFPDSEQEKYFHATIGGYFYNIKKEIEKKVEKKIAEKGEIDYNEIQQIIADIIENHYDKCNKAEDLPSIPKNHGRDIIVKYKDLFDSAIKIFEKIPISGNILEQLKAIAGNLFSKDMFSSAVSGVVIAGFGEEDIFPSLESFDIEGIVNNKLKYKKRVSKKIDFKNSASIIPFAQKEMVYTFMEGINPDYKNIEETYLSKIFNDYSGIIVDSIKTYDNKEKNELKEKLININKGVLDSHRKKLEDYRKNNYVIPITLVVSMLPKDELAAMAESLVSLTSFKRKVTMERETVGGPIDVAVISKGDGFIWIKRKHYFKPELNPQFLSKYYKEVQNDK